MTEKNDEKEVLEIKKIYNAYLDKRKKIMKNTQFTPEYVFNDNKSKDFILTEHITKPDSFSTKRM